MKTVITQLAYDLMNGDVKINSFVPVRWKCVFRVQGANYQLYCCMIPGLANKV
jgi:hypothetical protein